MPREFKLPEGAEEIPTGGRFMKWENVGDSITGVVLRMELSKKYAGENFIAVFRTDGGERVAVSAPLQLRRAIEDYDLVGRRIHVIYIGDTESKGGTVKEFKVGALPHLKTPDEEADSR